MNERRAIALLIALAFAFRLPALASDVNLNSDAAIVGLQAMHLWRGEHAVFLWGSGYQTSVDSYVAALFFLLGASAFALVLSSLALHVLATIFVWDVARRRLTPWFALLASSPLVLSGAAIDSYALSPPRQASLTLAVAAIWAAARQRALAAGALALLALYADPYAILFVPASLVIARDRRWLAGAALGVVPVLLRALHPAAKHGVLSASLDVTVHNARLLWDPCGPWFLGARIFTAPEGRWVSLGSPILWLGAISFFGVLALALLRARDPLIGAALLVCALTVAGFLVSPMVMDAFSMRYLAAVALVLPLLAIPALERGRAWLFAPCALTFALSGFMAMAPFWGSQRGEGELARALAARGVKYAIADYWAAYRVTFLTREELVIVPLHPEQDRYAPYREAFARADRFAYVFDPRRSAEDERAAERAFGEPIERLDVGAYRAAVFTRSP